MTVAACSIVEGIGVISHVGDRQIPVLIDLFLDSFLLQAAEERLGYGVIPAVAFPAHTRFKAIRAAESPPCVAAELSSLIGMNQRTARSAAADRHQHSVEHEPAMNGRLGSPPH